MPEYTQSSCRHLPHPRPWHLRRTDHGTSRPRRRPADLMPCGIPTSRPPPCRRLAPAIGRNTDMTMRQRTVPLQTVLAMREPATMRSGYVRPMRPCFVNPGFGTSARHTAAGPTRADAAQPALATIFPCACRAFLASQNRRARRCCPSSWP